MDYTRVPQILMRQTDQADQPAEKAPDEPQSAQKASRLCTGQTVLVAMAAHSVFSGQEC